MVVLLSDVPAKYVVELIIRWGGRTTASSTSCLTLSDAVCRRQWLDAEHGTHAAAAMLAEAAAEEAAAASALHIDREEDLHTSDQPTDDRYTFDKCYVLRSVEPVHV
jgi:hypothetical protein